MPPRVSVIMAVHNGAAYLSAAVASVLGQTLTDFEFIIVNDGSTDDTARLLNEQARADGRVRLVTQADRRGLSRSLNAALDLAQGEFVARLDADDICLPERLAAQTTFLEARPGLGVCGAWVETIDASSQAGPVLRYPVGEAVVRCWLLFENPLAHPAVMFRRRPLAEAHLRYNADFRYAQDYELWTRVVEVLPIDNVPRVLVRYRRHTGQAGQQHLAEQSAAAAQVRAGQLARLRLNPTSEEQALHDAISTAHLRPERAEVERAEAWLQRLSAANRAGGFFPEPAFRQVLARRWYITCGTAARLGPWVWRRFQESSLLADSGQRRELALKLAARCLVTGWRPRWNG